MTNAIPVHMQIQQSINSGSVFSMPRSKLEEFVAFLSRPRVFEHFSASEFPATCETVRMALSIRVSEDANAQAKRESRIAIIVSSAALVVGLVSAGAALWPIVNPKPTEVYSLQTNPVHAVLPEQSLQPTQQVVAPKQTTPSTKQSSQPGSASAKSQKQ